MNSEGLFTEVAKRENSASCPLYTECITLVLLSVLSNTPVLLSVLLHTAHDWHARHNSFLHSTALTELSNPIH